MSKKLIVGNWKMNPASSKKAENILLSILKAKSLPRGEALRGHKLKADVIICPPFIYLERISELLKAISYKLKATLGAQDVFYEKNGAYTGEVSAEMLKNSGVKYVIVGHSERRALGETDEIVSKKVHACLNAGLIPIVCVGESERDDSHSYFNFVKQQLKSSLSGVVRARAEKIVVAYEPVWAIGVKAKKEATPEECGEMIIFIRKTLADLFGPAAATRIRILYGGSVEPKNAAEYISAGVDGLLVGRDSLDPKKFGEIIKMVKLI